MPPPIGPGQFNANPLTIPSTRPALVALLDDRPVEEFDRLCNKLMSDCSQSHIQVKKKKEINFENSMILYSLFEYYFK